MSAAASYRPSPLSFNSPRASPFRRPESPSSPSPLRHSTTPTTSPTKPAAAGTPSPSKLNHSNQSPSTGADTWTPRGLVATVPSHREPPTSPTRGANSPRPGSSSTVMMAPSPRPAPPSAGGNMNAVSKLQPAQVRELREGFQILDRDSDGVVGREDVAEMLTQLAPPTLTLPAFLTHISSQLAALSPPTELLNAFAAFDDDDSGQVDLAQLRDALLHTAPEHPGETGLTGREIDKVVAGFSGRQAFGKSSSAGGYSSGGGGGGQMMGIGMGVGVGKRGEVFRYQEFVQAVVGGSGSGTGSGNGKGAKGGNDGADDDDDDA